MTGIVFSDFLFGANLDICRFQEYFDLHAFCISYPFPKQIKISNPSCAARDWNNNLRDK